MALIGVLAWQSLFVQPDITAEKKPLTTADPETGETEELEEIQWGEGLRPRSGGRAQERGLLHGPDPGP